MFGNSLPKLAETLASKYTSDQEVVACLFGMTGSSKSLMAQLIRQYGRAVVYNDPAHPALCCEWAQAVREKSGGFIVTIQANTVELAQDMFRSVCHEHGVPIPSHVDFYEMPKGRLMEGSAARKRWQQLVQKSRDHTKAVAIITGKVITTEEVAEGFKIFSASTVPENAPEYMLKQLMQIHAGDPHKALAIRQRIQASAHLGRHALEVSCNGMSEEMINTVIAEAPLEIDGIIPSFRQADWLRTAEDLRQRYQG